MLAFWELLTVLTKEMYKNINLLIFLHIKLLMWEAGDEQVGKILCCTEREILQYKYECIKSL
jgi:triphosphoribosyl-dephospho-CoA synthetase